MWLPYPSAAWLSMMLTVSTICQEALGSSPPALFGSNVCGLNATIIFAQASAQSGQLSSRGFGIRYGLEAAFYEANVTAAIPGLSFRLESYDDQYLPAKARQYAEALSNRSDIFAMIGWLGTATAEAALPSITAGGYPFIGVLTGAPFLSKPFSKHIVNLRPSYLDETATVVEYLINVKKIKRIALLMQNDSFGEACREGLLLALESNNLRLHSEGRYPRGTSNISAALQYIANHSDQKPEAVIVGGVSEASAVFIREAAKVLPLSTMYAALSNVAQPFVDILANNQSGVPATVLRNIVVTQVVPLAHDTSQPIVMSYQAAMHQAAASPSSPLGTNNLTSYDSSAAIEGYMVGRLVVDAIRRIGTNTFTRERFLEEIYDSGSFNFDGLRCGPLLPKDLNGGCNICMRTIGLTSIAPQGRYQKLEDQPYFSFDSCGYLPKAWTFLKFGQILPRKGMHVANSIAFNTGLRAAFQDINDAGGLLGIKLDLTSVYDDLSDGSSSAAQSNAVLSLVSNPDLLAILGSSWDSRTAFDLAKTVSGQPLPFIGSPYGSLHLRRPFDRTAINLRASYYDEAMAMIKFLYETHAVTRVSILYTDDSFGQELSGVVRDALATKRLSAASQYAYNAVSSSSLNEALRHLMEGGEASGQAPEAIIMIVPTDVLIAFVTEAIRSWGSSFPDLWFLAFSTVESSEVGEQLAAAAVASPSALDRFLFSSVVPLPTNTDLKVVRDFHSSVDRLNKTAERNAATLEGYLTAQMLISGLKRLAGSFDSREKLLNAFYDSGSFSFGDLQCGPFIDSSDEGEPCNQCMKNVWLTGLSRNGSVYDLPESRLNFESCGFRAPLNVDFELGTTRLAVAILAAVFTALALVLVVLLCYHRQYVLLRGSFKFTLVTCFGAIMCYAVVFALYPLPTNAVCVAQPWIGHLSFCFIFGPLFAKTRRVALIFSKKKLTKVLITDSQVMKFFAGILSFFVFYMTLWTLLDPPRMVETWVSGSGERYEACASQYSWTPWGIVAAEGVMLLWGSLLCFRVQGAVTGKFQRFNESRQIGFAIYNTSFLGALLVFLNFLDFPPTAHFVLNSIFIILNTTVVLAVLIGKPLFLAVKGVVVPESQLAGSSTKGKDDE